MKRLSCLSKLREPWWREESVIVVARGYTIRGDRTGIRRLPSCPEMLEALTDQPIARSALARNIT